MKDSKYLVHHPGSHYLLFWPLFWLRYLLLEQLHPAAYYHPMHCSLDDHIPFLEVFIIPYLLWHLCIVGMHLWLYIREDPAFLKYSRYLMMTMSISTMLFLIYPTCQTLRPVVFPRDNSLTGLVDILYQMDTSTNVCPSEHVIGAAGFFLAAIYEQHGTHCRRFLFAGGLSFLTAIATVFLKQHSILDVAAAVPVCLLGWYFAFYRPLKWELLPLAKLHHFFNRSSA